MYSAQIKHAVLVKTKEKSKSQKQFPKKKVSLEILDQRLGNRYTRSLLSRYTVNVWQVIDLRVDYYPFYTSFQKSRINKKAR